MSTSALTPSALTQSQSVRRARALRHPNRPDEILDAACRAIVERGFAHTRVIDIAQAAGTSTGTIHYYFDSREEVLAAALKWATDRLLGRLGSPEGTSATRRLARLLAGSIPDRRFAPRREEYVLWIEMWTLVLHDRARLPSLEELSARWRAMFRDAIREGTAAGELDPPAGPEVASERIVALVDGLGFETVIGYSWSSPERMRSTLVAFACEQLNIDRAALEREMTKELSR
jgi:AcrR family transcriptional regulator